jgi:hypothetical protein
MGFSNFINELDSLQSMEIQRNLGLELGVTETHGSSLYYGDPEEFRIRIEGQGVAPHEMDFL